MTADTAEILVNGEAYPLTKGDVSINTLSGDVILTVEIRDETKRFWSFHWDRITENPSTVTFLGDSYAGWWVYSECTPAYTTKEHSVVPDHVIRAEFKGKQVKAVAP